MGTTTILPAALARRLLLVIAAALALGACSKCDVPDIPGWWHGNNAPAPASCHSDPPVQ
jgi:hypothetical protein